MQPEVGTLMNIKEMMADLTGDHSEVESNAQGFGTFKGVYIYLVL